MEDIIKIHEATCPNFHERKVQLSCDGVSESKSTVVSLDVYSIKFNKCQQIYPVKIIRPLKKIPIDHLHHLQMVVRDIYNNDCSITQFVGDNPKRATAKGCLCHSSWFPCEYCFSKGCKVVRNKNDVQKKKNTLRQRKK